MKILILTQEENLYLPNSFATVCQKRKGDICCIISAPAMSTHGGPVKGFIKHLNLFGLMNTIRIIFRLIRAKILSKTISPSETGPFYSIQNVATAFSIPYYSIEKIKGEELQKIIDQYEPELLISISCPQIIGKKVRDRFSKGCINVHGAPLPKYRGLMPAFWALKNNESETAATVHDLDKKLDDGDILHQSKVEITRDDTWDSLVRKTKHAGALGLLEVIDQIELGTETRRPNEESEATYFSFPTAEDRKEFIKAGRRFI